MNEIGRKLFRSDASPCLNKGVTLARFQSSGNIPESKDLSKRSHKETEIRSARSRIILAEILSRPVALDLHNLFMWENNTTACRRKTEVVVIYIYVTDIT